MGVASLVLGIVSIVLSFIPIIGVSAFFTAGLSIALGIGDMIEKSRKKQKFGKSIAGVILSGVSIIVIAFWLFVVSIFSIGSLSYDDINVDRIIDEIDTYYNDNNYDYDYDYDYDFYRNN